jgi:lipoprotein NlpI
MFLGLHKAVLYCLAVAVLALAGTTAPGLAQTAQQWKCTGNADIPWDVQIIGCTNAIQSGKYVGKNLTGAYLNRGLAYDAEGDYDHALADYDQAIRLDPNNATAYNNRGNAYQKMDYNERAIADYNEAIRLDPKYAAAYNDRGHAYQKKSNNDRAMADYNEAIRLDPKYATAYYNRGLANFYAGSLPKSLADLNEASELDPKNAYMALWLDIVSKRSKLPGRLAQAITQIDMAKWPGPVIRLFLGQMTFQALLAAADDPNVKTKQSRVCEANFYGAELAIQTNWKDDALRLFVAASAGCPKTFTEWAAANAELKVLRETP